MLQAAAIDADAAGRRAVDLRHGDAQQHLLVARHVQEVDDGVLFARGRFDEEIPQAGRRRRPFGPALTFTTFKLTVIGDDGRRLAGVDAEDAQDLLGLEAVLGLAADEQLVVEQRQPDDAVGELAVDLVLEPAETASRRSHTSGSGTTRTR